MKTSGGFEQSYNARIAVDTDSMLITGNYVTQACNDKQQITPMLAVLAAHSDQVGQPAQLSADTGYFSEANVRACVGAGITPLIAIKRDEPHPPLPDRWTEPPPLAADADDITTMKHKLKTTSGRADYGLRKQTVEPVFGIIRHGMNFRQFLLRGVEKVGHEWNLVALAWNIKRMIAMKIA